MLHTLTHIAVELNVVSFLFSNQNTVFKVEVNCSNDFIFAGLENGVLNVLERNVDVFALCVLKSEAI